MKDKSYYFTGGYLLLFFSSGIVAFLFIIINKYYIGDFYGVDLKLSFFEVFYVFLISNLPLITLWFVFRKYFYKKIPTKLYSKTWFSIFAIVLFLTVFFIVVEGVGILGVVDPRVSDWKKAVLILLVRLRVEYLIVFLFPTVKTRIGKTAYILLLIAISLLRHSLMGVYYAGVLVVMDQYYTSSQVVRRMQLIMVLVLILPAINIVYGVRDSLRNVEMGGQPGVVRLIGRINSLSNSLVGLQEDYFKDRNDALDPYVFLQQGAAAFFGSKYLPSTTIEVFYQSYFGNAEGKSAMMPGFPGVFFVLMRKSVLIAVISMVVVLVVIELSFMMIGRIFGRDSMVTIVILYTIPIMSGTSYDIFMVFVFFCMVSLIQKMFQLKLL